RPSLVHHPHPPPIYTLSLHDALPISNAGVSNILFKNDTLSGTDSSGITSSSNNGMRIKSYSSVGGLVSTVTYEGICMTRVKTSPDRKSTRLNSSHVKISYAVFCLKKK